MKNNIITDKSLRFSLAVALQDAWHYATLIVPIKGAESTFAGACDYRGLPGMIHAYNNLFRLACVWQREELPAFNTLELVHPENINTTGELRHQTRIIFKAVERIADANGIDAYNGTFKHADTNNLV